MPEVIDIHVHGTRDWIGVSTRVYNSTSSHIVLLGQDAAMPRVRRLESQSSLHTNHTMNSLADRDKVRQRGSGAESSQKWVGEPGYAESRSRSV